MMMTAPSAARQRAFGLSVVLLIVLLIAVVLTPRLATAVGTTEPIDCDAALTRSIDDPSEADHFTFNVVEGEQVDINVIDGTPLSGNFSVQWRLLTGAGTPAVSCGGDTDPRFGEFLRDCGPLPASGNPYEIEVRDQFSDGTGTYVVYLQRLTAAAACETTPIACDESPSATIDPAAESDLLRFNFNVVEGEQVDINVINGTPLSGNFSVQWRLLTGAGTPAASCGGYTDPRFGEFLRDCGPLPASGNPYEIEVRDQFSDGTGTYMAHVQRLGAAVACESMPACVIDPQVESDLVRFEFAVTDGQTVNINVVNGTPISEGFSVQWRLLTGAGTPAVSCGGYTDPRFGEFLRDCGPLPASGNPYQIEVRDQFSDGIGAYRVAIDGVLQCPPCGNGTINPGEVCDPPGQLGCPTGQICNATCTQCVTTTTTSITTSTSTSSSTTSSTSSTTSTSSSTSSSSSSSTSTSITTSSTMSTATSMSTSSSSVTTTSSTSTTSSTIPCSCIVHEPAVTGRPTTPQIDITVERMEVPVHRPTAAAAAGFVDPTQLGVSLPLAAWRDADATSQLTRITKTVTRKFGKASRVVLRLKLNKKGRMFLKDQHQKGKPLAVTIQIEIKSRKNVLATLIRLLLL